MTDTELNAVKAFLSAYRYTELDLRVRRAELTRLTARKGSVSCRSADFGRKYRPSFSLRARDMRSKRRHTRALHKAGRN